jgi:hypothetical protein
MAYLLVRYLSTRRGHEGKSVRVSRDLGQLVGEEDLTDEEEHRFTGAPTNTAIVRGYVTWRRKLAEQGILFRRDRTADEGERYLQSRITGGASEGISRITDLFNAARYGLKELPAEEAREFKGLTQAILTQVKEEVGSRRIREKR